MPFSLGSRLTPNLPLTRYLTDAATCFHTVEIPTDPRFLSPHFPLNEKSKQTLRVYRERYRFHYTMHAPFVSLGALDPEERGLALNIFRSVITVAAELEIPLITFHPSMLEPSDAASYQEICRYEEESLSRCLAMAQSAGIALAIENMPKDPKFHPEAADGARIRELLSCFPGPGLGVTLDIGHALQAGADLNTLLNLDRIRHFHLHENDRQADRHHRIIANLDWWKGLMAVLNEKFPQAVGILEMNQLIDQMESYHRLQEFFVP